MLLASLLSNVSVPFVAASKREFHALRTCTERCDERFDSMRQSDGPYAEQA
jgi:hypothetical protein